MEPNKGEIVMYQPDETIRLEVSHWDRYLGMMTAMTQVPVPMAGG